MDVDVSQGDAMASRYRNTPSRRHQRQSPDRSKDSPSLERETTAARAACEGCRRLKMRCIRPPEQGNGLNEPCERCKRSDRPCTIPERKPQGRKPGALGRYHGIEKVYRKMQSEIRKARSSVDGAHRIQEITSHAEAEGETEILQMLLTDGTDISDINFSSQTPDGKISNYDNSQLDIDQSPQQQSNITDEIMSPLPEIRTSPPSQTAPADQSREPINNPLALLADASGAAQALHRKTAPSITSPLSHEGSAQSYQSPESSGCGLGRQLLSRPGYVSLGLRLSRGSLEQGLEALFIPANQSENRHLDYFKQSATGAPRDTGPDLDPVDLGLVTMEEAYYLFPIYFTRLHPVNGILDPILHTPEYVRSRSALLFTWILALTSQFEPSCSSLAKRLRLHGDKLSKHVHTSGFKSVEIIQGYYISLLSATPAKTIAEERLWLYTNYAFSIAAELGLDQRARPRGNPGMNGGGISSNIPTRIPSPLPPGPGGTGPFDNSTRPNGEGELLLQDPTYLMGQRVARNRERTWLRILLWERANSAACGRITTFPETELTQNIESWWLHPLADSADKSTCAFILLRREMAALHTDLRTQACMPHPSNPHWLVERVDSALQPWTQRWISPAVMTAVRTTTAAASIETEFSAVYLYYVYIHGRLWTLCYALYYVSKNNDTCDEQDLNAIREDCFAAAVKVCEMAVRDLQTMGESLYCMLAPTWAMISYAAVLALQLFPLLYGTRSGYEIELLSLLGQVALQLQRAGSTPAHRFGIAALLGQHLLMILRTRAASLNDSVRSTDDKLAPVDSLQQQQHHQLQSNQPQQQQQQQQQQQEYNDSLEASEIPSYDQFLTSFDPFFAPPPNPADMECNGEAFADMFRELFGQGFGGAF